MIKPDHMQQLAQRLYDGQLALFVGAGISRLAPRCDGGAQRLPLWKDLARLVADRCHEDPAAYRDEVLDLFDAIAYGQERAALEEAVREALDDRSYALSDAHRALASLPWSAVLTTNYDGLLARVFDERPIANEDGYDRLVGRSKPRLFQIHGTLDTPHTLTREDYRLWEETHPRAYRHLESILLNGTILFVGYSLSDPHLDSLLATVRKVTRGREKRIFAWMWRAPEAQIKLLDRRDKIEVVSIEEEDGWSQAFTQLAEILRDLQETGEGDPPTVSDTSAYERVQYSQALEVRYGAANLQGLYTWGAGYARGDVTFEEIYVEPDLVCAEGDGPVDAKREIFAPGKGGRDSREGPAERRERASRVLERESRLVVVAAPGQGKSTLLRHRLLTAARRWRERPSAEPLPIYIRLSDWETRAEGGAPSLLGYALAELPLLGEIGSDAVRAWTSSSVLWLLDGVDEIRDRFERERLREEVTATAALRPNDHWVVATRPAGEPPGGFAAGWRRAEMPSFSDSGVRQVIARWARVLERKEGLRLDADELHRSMERDRGLQRLRGNSLLLTLAVLFYKTRHRLPQDRWEFYEVAEQVLRDSWLHHRLRHAAELIPGAYLPEILERLAFSGMLAGHVLFTTEDLEKECRAVLASRDYDGAAQDREIQLFLRAAEDLIGILVAQGPASFGFLHLTFQEFLAARYLSHHADQVSGLLGRLWDHPDWQEVWSLYALAVQAAPTRHAQLFQGILDHAHPLDTQLQRHRLACLRLAGLGAAPLPEPALGVVQWATQVLEGGPEILRDQVLHTLEGWNRVSFPDRLQAVLLRLISDDSSPVRASAVVALSPAIAGNDVRREVIARLDDEKPEVRSAAVFAFSAILSVKEVRRTVLAHFEDPHAAVRRSVGSVLSAWVGDEEVRRKFMSLLEEPHENERLIGVQALAAAVPVDGGIRQELLARLDDRMPLVRSAVVTALSAAAGEAEIRQKLLARLDDEEPDVRAAVAEALASEAESEDVWRELLAHLRDESAQVRRAAASALARVSGEADVGEALLSRLRDKSPEVIVASVAALSSALGDLQVRSAITALLGSKRPFVRAAAAQALSSLAGEDGDTRRALISLLNDPNVWVVIVAIESLSSLVGHRDVAKGVLACLRVSARIVQYRAAEALSVVTDRKKIRDHLIEQLGAEDAGMRSAVAGALSGATGYDDVRRGLVLRLTDDEAGVRFSAADSLRGVAGDVHVREALLALLSDDDWDVRSVAFEILAESIASERRQLSDTSTSWLIDQIEQVAREFDSQALEQILTGHMMAICGEANQIFRELTKFDFGIDGEVEFKDNDGRASGKKIYVQLKSGASYLRTRKADGKEVFDVKNPRHLGYWISQPVDVYLVIRDAKETIRWMNVTTYLKRRPDGQKASRQIVFKGEKLDASTISKVRDMALGL